MTTDRHVLILSTIADIATDYVVQGLLRRGIPHHRVNTEDLPFSRSLIAELANRAGVILQEGRTAHYKVDDHQHGGLANGVLCVVITKDDIQPRVKGDHLMTEMSTTNFLKHIEFHPNRRLR